MVFPVPPKKEPADPVRAAGCLGAVIGALVVFVAMYLTGTGGGGLGRPGDEDGIFTDAFLFFCCCGFPVWVGGLFGFWVGRWLGGRYTKPGGPDPTESGEAGR
jgi:hypothetical protein